MPDTAPAGRDDDAGPIFLTIATGDRAAQARIFARSARACHPEARLAIVIPDAVATGGAFDGLYDLVISAAELQVIGLADMRFRYSTAELCYALKPWAIKHLLDRCTGSPVYYFDADIELFTPLAEAAAALAEGASLVLTPHILDAGRDPARERDLLRSGSFNAGFLAVAPTPPAHRFVEWWCDRARTGCTHDPLEGTYGDQKWLELAPSICDGVVVLRHPGYNFAYWNAHERPLSRSGDTWTASGAPLRFLHYSRWDLRRTEAGQYLEQFFAGDHEPLDVLCTAYRRKVREEEGCGEVSPCHAIAAQSAGEPDWPQLVRDAYARHAPAIDGDIGAVRAHAVAILDAPSAQRAVLGGLPMTVLYDDMWRHHGDLRYRYAIDQEHGRLGFLQWLAGAGELGIPTALLESARTAVEHRRVCDLETADGMPEEVPPDEPGAVIAESAARGAENRRVGRLQDDIRLLVRSNKGLRREVQSLRVGRWRDEERIAALEAEYARTRRALDVATRRARQLDDELARLRGRQWRKRLAVLSFGTSSAAAPQHGRLVLAADRPFFERGFRLGDEAVVANGTVKRPKAAPSGMLVYGPYLKLPAGTYTATITARLYERLPLSAACKLDVVHDGGQRIVGVRDCRLYSPAGWRRFSLPFTVLAGEEAAEFELRVWSRKGTPLEIAEIELHEMLP